MNFAYDLSGGTPVVKRAKINATFSNAGAYATEATDGTAGVIVGLATTVTMFVGSNLDTGTYSTTQGDAEGVISLLVNPFAVYRMLMANSATAGTQLVVTTNSVAETAGTVVTITTGDPAPNSPQMDEGTMVCIQGANVGQTRKITSTAATTATVTVPFLRDIAANDVFLIVPWTPFDVAGDNIQLTSSITQARQDIAVGTGADFRPLDLEFDVSSVTNARRNSFVYATHISHVLTQGT